MKKACVYLILCSLFWLFSSITCGRSFSQVVSITNGSGYPVVVYGNWSVGDSDESAIKVMLCYAKFRKLEADSTINDTIRWDNMDRGWEPWSGKMGYLFVKDTIDVGYFVEEVISGKFPYHLYSYTYDELKKQDFKITYTEDAIDSTK